MPLIMGVLGQKEYVLLRCGVFLRTSGWIVQQASSSGFISQIRVEVRPQGILHRDSAESLSRHMKLTAIATST